MISRRLRLQPWGRSSDGLAYERRLKIGTYASVLPSGTPLGPDLERRSPESAAADQRLLDALFGFVEESGLRLENGEEDAQALYLVETTEESPEDGQDV